MRVLLLTCTSGFRAMSCFAFVLLFAFCFEVTIYAISRESVQVLHMYTCMFLQPLFSTRVIASVLWMTEIRIEDSVVGAVPGN